MSLFDASQYTARGKTPKEDRRKRAAPTVIETVPVCTSLRWRVVSAKHPGVVHAACAAATDGGVLTWCGIVAGTRSFPDGLAMHGCKACWETIKTGRRPVRK